MAIVDWLRKRVAAPGKAADPAPAENSGTSAGTQDASVRCKERGNAFLAAGRLDDAAACYREAVAINPAYAEAFLNLGFALREQKVLEDAERCLRQAMKLDPAMPDAHYVLGTVLAERHALPDAIESFGKALVLKPDFDAALRDLCRAYLADRQDEAAQRALAAIVAADPPSAGFHCFLGDLHEGAAAPDQAIARYARAIAIDPRFAPAHENMGKALQQRGRLDEAVACYREAIAINPHDPGTHNNLGIALTEQGKVDEAAAALRTALGLDPDFAFACGNLAALLQGQGRLDEALVWYRKALAANPEFAEAQSNLGTALMEEGKPDAAIACYRKAIAINPGYVDAHSNLGIAFKRQGRLAEAEASLRTAVQLDPNHANAHQNLAVVLHAAGKTESVLACYRRALELKPDDGAIRMYYTHQAQHECDWTGIEAHVQAVREAVRDGTAKADNPISPFSFLALPGSTAAEQKLCGEAWARNSCRYALSMRSRTGFAFTRRADGPIHVGYLSTDFRQHPVPHLMAEVFELHDRSRFRISAYSYGPDDGSAMRRRLAKAFDTFVDIRELGDDAAARRIHADGVDILVDLSGFTAGARSSILALRPAPVQVNYLGYPGTLGADLADYLIADRFVVPPEQRHCYGEHVVWLPDCLLPSDRTLARLPAPSRAACGLPERGIVFCCFNQPYKITPDIFRIWCRLLAAVPESTLWLKAGMQAATDSLRREARRQGVDPARLVMASHVATEQEHLARLQCADLFVDTHPYNAHTTCSDALWMGLPVVTYAGETFPSRVAGSLLTALRVPELITYSLDDYHARALDLATDHARREDIRRRIRANRDSTPAFDAPRFTRSLEALYLRMEEQRAEAFPASVRR